ncbi:UDP-N-acetylglucosamine 4,6-dehydratase [Capnocytophaga sp. oral taxon 864]|jgi:polysaccharide biosynthesis protein|uniref:UDP-N-acetylglucosamine 4,6-dehydratase n=1 Tax=Capnocytophaga sp. oral taxon 864 TaxID=1316593 RepID=UPI000D038EE5|nr:UDP-N-acetylglucosamine 4,6-dehydratase [Capnocytophaga sp. oral taxon 864]AVM55780.1 nucleoside-diphosphate sugar epimerase [Capnocytophaga sp. oral taxon 864]
MLNIEHFISKYVTKRPESMFQADLYTHQSALTKAIEGKSVLVIGGAGSIGSSYIKALLPFKPKTLVVVDISENGLTELTRELRSTSAFTVPTDYITYPMNYADDTFVKMFKARGGFDIVANFSAHKHVRSEKDKYSVEALLKNNVVNAKKFLDLLCDYPPEHFFCVSTDKAANPVNIMGGSKKIMEDMIMAYAHKFPVTTARFANVAFSNGSLPAGFLERIAKNQPLSAPSDVTRYFVSPEESGQICLMACILGSTGQIYFPKLKKEQVLTFSEIASQLLKDLGYTPLECKSEAEAIAKAESRKETDKRYPVYFSKSDTTGEKPYEEFYTEGEQVALDKYTSLGVISLQSFKKITEIESFIDKLTQLFDNPATEKKDITLLMKTFLVNFDHQETGRYLDSKM